MSLTEEMQKMVEACKENDISKEGLYKRYFAPEIPDKIMGKLMKHFDNGLAINSIVAFFSENPFDGSNFGFIITNDGFYYRDFGGKATYYRYVDINNLRAYEDKYSFHLDFWLNNDPISISSTLDMKKMKVLLEKLIEIDKVYGQSSLKMSGKIKKIELPEDIKKKCHAIIHPASVATGGVGTGLAQIPGSDNVVIVPIQIGMITALGKVFDLHITEGMAKGIIASAGATIAGRTASQILVGWMPGVGNVINTATAAGITEAIGWIAVNNFYSRWLNEKNKGKLEGKKEGYIEASAEYERKLRQQADEFLNQMKDVERERNEYEDLLREYEQYIHDMETKDSENVELYELKYTYENLKKLDSRGV